MTLLTDHPLPTHPSLAKSLSGFYAQKTLRFSFKAKVSYGVETAFRIAHSLISLDALISEYDYMSCLLALLLAHRKKKGRFEAREGWSEAEPFLLHGGM